MSELEYIGNELELFEEAENWKNYWSSKIFPFVDGDVLEVGAGLGGTTAVLSPKCNYNSWLCLEPDSELSDQILEKKNNQELDSKIDVFTGLIDELPSGHTYDTIVYIDVIEHIENDNNELVKAFERLNRNGHLIILVPAHNWLYSPFDKAIGHFRRYDKSRLKAAIPSGMKKRKLFYLDGGGFVASIFNKIFLKQAYPTKGQIRFWDKIIIPVSKIADRIIGYSTGKSLIGVWEKI